MSEIAFHEQAAKTIEILSKGAFLTTSWNGKDNVMTIAWGTMGFIWGKPIFMSMVRHSRYTYQLIEKNGFFTVSVPYENMQKALGICGSKSGRDTDKIAEAGLVLKAGTKVPVPVIDCRGVHYECKVVCKQTLEPGALDAELRDKWYASPDYHTLYYGEIVASYLKD